MLTEWLLVVLGVALTLGTAVFVAGEFSLVTLDPGVVEKQTRADDRRSFIVKLTPQGRRQFKRMAATHEGWIVELFAGWTPAQKTQVHELLAQLKTHLKDKTP